MTETPEPQTVDGRMARGLRTRSELLRVAITLFGARGFHAVSMKELAETAGIKPASIYNHFASKELVLASALADGLRRFYTFVEGSDDPRAEPLSRLENLVKAHTAWQLTEENPVHEADSLLESVTAGELLDDRHREDIENLMLGYRRFVMSIIDDLRAECPEALPPTPVCTSALLDLCDRAHRWKTVTDSSTVDVQSYCWTMALGMLGLERHFESTVAAQ